MSGQPGIPQQFYVQTANQQNLVSWAQAPGATSYDVQRSLDNVTFTTVATVSGTPLATQYLDTAVTLQTQYFYKVAAINVLGSSPYTTAQCVTPTPTGEMTLAQIRQAAKERADMVKSNFLSTPEWNQNINKAMFELRDLLTTVYEDYFLAPPVRFVVNGSQNIYPLPNGSNTFLDTNNQPIVPPPFYKLQGIDLALNTAPNAFISVDKFNFRDRNNYVYPNSNSTIYGVFNLQYRVLGNNIHFIPTPSAGQVIQLWYQQRMVELLKDTDTTDQGISGWIEYVIVRAAKYALDKEESDSSVLTQEIGFLKARIEESASNRDAGAPDTINNVRGSSRGNGWGNSGPMGGF